MSTPKNEIRNSGWRCKADFWGKKKTIVEICNGLPPEEGKRLLRAIKFFVLISYISSGIIASCFWLMLLG